MTVPLRSTSPSALVGRALLLGALLVGCSSAPAPPASDAPSPATEPVATAAPDGPDATKSSRPAHASVTVPPVIEAIVNQPDREEADRDLDAGRHPAEMLAFFGLTPGARVAELGAGGGYTSELLARAVGDQGKVWGQNPKFILERFAEEPWSKRLAKPVMHNVVRVDREFDAPLPPEARDLDAVFVILFYHDLYWLEVDRAAMNRAVFAALKPGGVFGIVDHSAAEGAGSNVTKTLHRVEESLVRDEIEAAGFELADEGFFLRNPDDPLDWNAAPSASGDRRGTSDRFVLKFRKPASP